MLQDYTRTGTYYCAIMENVVDFQGKVVMDVGAGSGILSLFAAQAGAARVYAVEASGMAKFARQLAGANASFGKAVQVLHSKVESLQLPEEQKVDVKLTLEQAKRRKVVLEDEELAAARLKAEGGGGAGSQAEVKREVVDEHRDIPVLWRVNPEEFNRRFRHQTCVSLVTAKLGADAGTVLAAMLAHSRKFEASLQAEAGTAMTVSEVEASLAAGAAEGQLQRLSGETSVQQIMDDLVADSLMALQTYGVGPGGAQYTVNLLGLLEKARLNQMQAVIRDMFGVQGLRIFMLLMTKGYLEQKQIADYAMQPTKDTREILYKMLRSGLVVLQDIPRTADRAPSRTLYVWGADLQGAFKNLGRELYRGFLNVYLRLAHEVGQHKELLLLVECAQEAGALNFNMTDGQRKALERLQRSCGVLEGAIFSMDEMCALFNEY